MKRILVTLTLSILVAIPSWAITDFDSLTLLDDCNRTEAPLSNSGQWTTDVISTDASTQTANGTVCVRSGTAGIGSVWWNPETFGPNVAIVATMPTVATGSNQFLLLYLRLIQPGVASQTDGYYCAFGMPDNTVAINRIDNSTDVSLGSSCPSTTLSNGDRVACQAIGSTLSVYHNSGTGWQHVCSVTSSTYSAAGAVGFGTTLNTITVDTIRADTLPDVLVGEGLMPVIP